MGKVGLGEVRSSFLWEPRVLTGCFLSLSCQVLNEPVLMDVEVLGTSRCFPSPGTDLGLSSELYPKAFLNQVGEQRGDNWPP